MTDEVDSTGAPGATSRIGTPPQATEVLISTNRPLDQPPRSPGRKIVLALGAVIAFVLCATVVGFAAGHRRSPDRASVELAAQHFSDGVVAERFWVLSGDAADQLRATIIVSNRSSRDVVHSHDEVVPKAITAKAGDVQARPAPTSVVKADPVLRWCLDLAAGVSTTITYTVGVAPGSNVDTLDRWSADWRAAAAESHASEGKPCPRTAGAAPTATFDDSVARHVGDAENQLTIAGGIPFGDGTSPTTVTTQPKTTSTAKVPMSTVTLPPVPTITFPNGFFPATTAATTLPTIPRSTTTTPGQPSTIPPQPPGAPTGVTATGGALSVSVSWAPVDAATSYVVRDTSTGATLATVSTPSATIAGLGPCTPLTVDVLAIGPAGQSQPSAAAAATTSNDTPTTTQVDQPAAVGEVVTIELSSVTVDTDDAVTFTVDSSTISRDVLLLTVDAASGRLNLTVPADAVAGTVISLTWHATDACGAASPPTLVNVTVT